MSEAELRGKAGFSKPGLFRFLLDIEPEIKMTIWGLYTPRPEYLYVHGTSYLYM